jgi:uncharacterized protein YceK
MKILIITSVLLLSGCASTLKVTGAALKGFSEGMNSGKECPVKCIGDICKAHCD